MDDSRFDDLTRSVASSASRRSLMKHIAGAAALGALGTLGLETSALAKTLRSPGQTCRKNSDCTNNECIISSSSGRKVCGCGDVVTYEHFANNPSPVDTGVFVKKGERVSVTVTGVSGWCCELELDADGSGVCGGAGIPLSCGSLVGVVGGGDIFSDYSTFTQLGTVTTTVLAAKNGNLFIQYVDGCPECYGDNNGSLTVTVSTCV